MAHVRPHTPSEPAQFQPAPPDLALQGVLIGLQTQLLSGQEQLLDGYRRLADAQVRSHTAADDLPGHLVRFVADRDEVSNLAASLSSAARKDWMTLENLGTGMPLTEDFARPPLPAFGGRVRCRSIYAAAVMDDSAARRIVQATLRFGSWLTHALVASLRSISDRSEREPGVLVELGVVEQRYPAVLEVWTRTRPALSSQLGQATRAPRQPMMVGWFRPRTRIRDGVVVSAL